MSQHCPGETVVAPESVGSITTKGQMTRKPTICKPNRFNIVDNTQQYPLYCNYQYNMNNITISTISSYVLSTIWPTLFPTIHSTIRSFVLFCVSQNVKYGVVLPAILAHIAHIVLYLQHKAIDPFIVGVFSVLSLYPALLQRLPG